MQSIYTRDDDLTSVVADGIRELQEYKTAQYAGGSSIILYSTETVDTWDVVNADIGTAGLYSTWIITFVPDITQFAYVEFGLNYLYHSTATGFESIFYYIDPTIASGTGVQRFIVYTNNNLSGTTLLNLKFQVRSTSPGYIFWSRSAS